MTCAANTAGADVGLRLLCDRWLAISNKGGADATNEVPLSLPDRLPSSIQPGASSSPYRALVAHCSTRTTLAGDPSPRDGVADHHVLHRFYDRDCGPYGELQTPRRPLYIVVEGVARCRLTRADRERPCASLTSALPDLALVGDQIVQLRAHGRGCSTVYLGSVLGRRPRTWLRPRRARELGRYFTASLPGRQTQVRQSILEERLVHSERPWSRRP